MTVPPRTTAASAGSERGASDAGRLILGNSSRVGATWPMGGPHGVARGTGHSHGPQDRHGRARTMGRKFPVRGRPVDPPSAPRPRRIRIERMPRVQQNSTESRRFGGVPQIEPTMVLGRASVLPTTPRRCYSCEPACVDERHPREEGRLVEGTAAIRPAGVVVAPGFRRRGRATEASAIRAGRRVAARQGGFRSHSPRSCRCSRRYPWGSWWIAPSNPGGPDAGRWGPWRAGWLRRWRCGSGSPPAWRMLVAFGMIGGGWHHYRWSDRSPDDLGPVHDGIAPRRPGSAASYGTRWACAEARGSRSGRWPAVRQHAEPGSWSTCRRSRLGGRGTRSPDGR